MAFTVAKGLEEIEEPAGDIVGVQMLEGCLREVYHSDWPSGGHPEARLAATTPLLSRQP